MSDQFNTSGSRQRGQDSIENVEGGQLKAFVERIERLEEEKKAIADDIKDIYSEAKGTGFDTKVLRSLISLRKKDPMQVEEHDTILELYKNALGMK